MGNQLITLRIKSFMWEAVSLLGVGLLGFLTSPEFQELITKHFGETLIGSVLSLVAIGVVKHLRNKRVIKKARLGGVSEEKVVLL